MFISPIFRRSATGFSAVEVTVVVAIMAILAALASPGFGGLIERWRVRQAAEGLQSTLYYARSEAIKRGGNVVLQKSPNNTNGCTTAVNANDWGCGWFVCEDTNGNGSCDGTEPVLQHFDTPAGIHVSGCSGHPVEFNRWGTFDGIYLGDYLRFAIIPLGKNGSHPATRGLSMSFGGQITMSQRPKTCPS